MPYTISTPVEIAKYPSKKADWWRAQIHSESHPTVTLKVFMGLREKDADGNYVTDPDTGAYVLAEDHGNKNVSIDASKYYSSKPGTYNKDTVFGDVKGAIYKALVDAGHLPSKGTIE